MSQDPYTTRRDFALPGQPSPDAAEGGQDGSDVTPALGAAYSEQRPPDIDFAQTTRDPEPAASEDTGASGDAGDSGDTAASGEAEDADRTQAVESPAAGEGEQTLLDRTRPVPLPQQDRTVAEAQDRTVADVPRDVPVAPLSAAQPQAQAQPQPQPQPQQPLQAQPQPQRPPQPHQAQPSPPAPQGFPPPQAYPPPGFPPQGHVPQTAPSGAWHRQHYAVGVFLVLYGLTNLVTGLLGFSNRKMEVAVYFGDGLALPVLIVVKCLEALLLAVTAAGLLRRRDLWFLPALLGWVAGFAVLCVLDLFRGQYLTLAEHAVYTLLFGFLLFLSYALSARVRAARLQAAAPGRPAPPVQSAAPMPGTPGTPGTPGAPAPAPVPPGVPQQAPPQGLSRTQEIALNTLNRWQRPGAR